MSKVLHIAERQIAAAERAAYLAGLSTRRERARAVQAHFWVFEHDAQPGRFIEFTEAPSRELLGAARGELDGLPTDCWQETPVTA